MTRNRAEKHGCHRTGSQCFCGKADVTNSILDKWNKQGMFIRFMDGNKLNINPDNLVAVRKKDALVHFDDWTTDWDAELAPNEIILVKNKDWRKGLHRSAL